MKKGLKQGDCPEKWNLYYPELVESVHKEYYEVGSDVVQTNTFYTSQRRTHIQNLL